MENKIIPEYQSRFLWYVSWLLFFTGIYALYNGHYYLAPPTFLVWATSLNYWSHPDYSWRYYMDVICVRLSLLYQILVARYMENAKEYYVILSIGIFFYGLSQYYYRIRKEMWIATVCHSLLHFFANISSIMLYTSVPIYITLKDIFTVTPSTFYIM